MTYDVVIIGSGLGGLECAVLLARQGRKVCVLERQTALGGSMQSIPRFGIRMDTGLHYVGGLDRGQSLHDHFNELGLLDIPWQRLDPDGFDLVTIAGDTFRFAEGFEQFAETMGDYFPKERDALHGYVRMLEASGNMSPLESAGAWDYLQQQFQDDLLRNVLCGSSTKMELNRDTLPLFVFAHINAPFIQSSWRLKGDGGILVDKLVSEIHKYGGETYCNANVTQFTEKDGLIANAVTDDGRCFEAKQFISNAHPSVTADMIPECRPVKKSYRSRMAAMENTFGLFTVSTQIKPDTIKYFNHNKFIYRNADVWDFYKKEGPISGVMVCCRYPENGSEYTQNIDILTPMMYNRLSKWSETRAGRRGDDYIAFKNSIADECIKLAETQLPGLKAAIAHRCISSPLTWRDYNGNPEGSAYGARKDWHTPLLSYSSPATPIANLFNTGQSLVLHGLQGVTATAFDTVRLLTNK